jgi:hypothetical protein
MNFEISNYRYVMTVEITTDLPSSRERIYGKLNYNFKVINACGEHQPVEI